MYHHTLSVLDNIESVQSVSKPHHPCILSFALSRLRHISPLSSIEGTFYRGEKKEIGDKSVPSPYIFDYRLSCTTNGLSVECFFPCSSLLCRPCDICDSQTTIVIITHLRLRLCKPHSSSITLFFYFLPSSSRGEVDSLPIFPLSVFLLCRLISLFISLYLYFLRLSVSSILFHTHHRIAVFILFSSSEPSFTHTFIRTIPPSTLQCFFAHCLIFYIAMLQHSPRLSGPLHLLSSSRHQHDGRRHFSRSAHFYMNMGT